MCGVLLSIWMGALLFFFLERGRGLFFFLGIFNPFPFLFGAEPFLFFFLPFSICVCCVYWIFWGVVSWFVCIFQLFFFSSPPLDTYFFPLHSSFSVIKVK